LVDKVKAEGKGKDYDCVIGVSGGCDSTATAYYIRKLGLRPIAVHFDNGWNSEIAVDNIKKCLDRLGIDLYTYVVDWDEFRDLLLSFIKAGVANCEAPTDHGICALLFHIARKFKLRYILTGSNLATEAIMPTSWMHYCQDLRQLKALHRQFGTLPMKTMPTISVPDYLYYVLVRKIRFIPFLNYIDYQKEETKRTLSSEIEWRDYGGKHYESVWTRFFQGYFLPVRFGIDKRRAHYSTMICAGQMTRDHALLELQKPTYPEDLLRDDLLFVCKKFGLSLQEFETLMKAPTKKHTDYPNHYFLFHRMERFKNIFRRIATSA
jgi:N-acetyl sugar amidotransferase